MHNCQSCSLGLQWSICDRRKHQLERFRRTQVNQRESPNYCTTTTTNYRIKSKTNSKSKGRFWMTDCLDYILAGLYITGNGMLWCGYQDVVDTTNHKDKMAKYRGPTIEVEKETIVRLRDVGTDNIATDDVCEDAADDVHGRSKYRDEGTDNIATDKNYITMDRQNSLKAKLRTYVKYLTMSTAGDTRPPLTTHILDTTRGAPAASVPMVLSIQNSPGYFTELEKGTTNNDGRGGFLNGVDWQPGVYKLHFDTGAYFAQQNLNGFYPFVEVVFTIQDPKQHYHVPLLLSPYSYSTYRGS